MKLGFIIGIAALLILGVFIMNNNRKDELIEKDDSTEKEASNEINLDNLDIGTFAGGCFWCMEAAFEASEGVFEAISGYTGGEKENPAYSEVSAGLTNHLEAVQVYYESDKVSYEDLLEVFWRNIDPTDNLGQFADRGKHYRTAIFYHDEEQRLLAEKSKEELSSSEVFSKAIVTEIRPFKVFYQAEEYHQDYYKKNVLRYKSYETLSGRKGFIEETWGDLEKEQTYSKPSDEELRETLTSLQYHVTQENGTERPFDNLYWNNKDEGIYVDIVSGEPLFSSKNKYASGTGWPSFYMVLEPENIVELEDNSHGMKRIEVRSTNANSHLGHLFNDGPQPSRKRYCINSASLKFIPVEELEKDGYTEYLSYFEEK